MDRYIDALQDPVFPIIQAQAQALGQPAFVIGGFVRDYLLGRTHRKDIDIVTVGSGIDLAQAVAQHLPHKPKVQVFKNYGTAMMQYGDIDLEFVGARKESYVLHSRNPQVLSGSLQDDQERRDFTINALAFSLQADDFGALLDPFDGLTDLHHKRIRTPLDPDITFSDDPLRMLRAVRFAAQLGFAIVPESFEAIQRNAHRLQIISGERIVDELHKILATPKPSLGLLLLYQTGLLELILPELTALNQVEEVEGHTHKNNFYHTLEVVDNMAEQSDDLWLRWAALLHDIGKAPTKRFLPKQGWTFHGHEFLGGKMVKKIFTRLHMPLNHKMKRVQKLVIMSSRPIVLSQDQVTDSAVRRLLFDAGDDIEGLMQLCAADITTKNPQRFRRYHKNFELVKQKLAEVEARDQVRNFQPPITGEDIMHMFALSPSREIGILKESVKEAILEGHIPNAFEAAYQWVCDKAIPLGLTLQHPLTQSLTQTPSSAYEPE